MMWRGVRVEVVALGEDLWWRRFDRGSNSCGVKNKP